MAQYRTGTVSVTNGSAVVTGSGTLWAANLSSGDYFFRSGDNVAYEIASVTNDTSLTLTAPYGGVTGGGQTYVGHIDFHPNGAPRFDKTDVDTWAILNAWMVKTYTAGNLGTAAFLDAQTSSTDDAANRLMKVGAFGLGGPAVRTADLNAAEVSGFYEYDNSSLNRPTTVGGKLLHIKELSTSYGQIAIENDANVYFRQTTAGVGAYSTWRKLYDTRNLNQLEFGGVGGGDDILAFGYATSATAAQFFLPISLPSVPASISEAGSFIISAPNGASPITGVSVFSLGAGSSNKIAVIFKSGLTGLTTNEPLVLKSSSVNSKITVNP